MNDLELKNKKSRAVCTAFFVFHPFERQNMVITRCIFDAMKKLVILTLTAAFISCSGGEEEAEKKKELTPDEMASEVCDCFKEKGADMECFELQGKYQEELLKKDEETARAFVIQTNECAN